MCMYTSPLSFWKHDLMLCYLGSMFDMVCLAVLEGLQPSPFVQCRFLSVGGSILHQSSRPSVLHFDMGLLTCFTPPSLLALPAVTSSVSGSFPPLVHHLPASMGIDIIPLPYIHVPLEVYSQNTLPRVFTHPQWMLQ